MNPPLQKRLVRKRKYRQPCQSLNKHQALRSEVRIGSRKIPQFVRASAIRHEPAPAKEVGQKEEIPPTMPIVEQTSGPEIGSEDRIKKDSAICARLGNSP